MMRYRKLTAALTAAALVYAPTPSFAQNAPQPALSHETGLQLADDDDDNHRKRRRLLLWLILGAVAAAALAYLLLHNGDEDDLPSSP